MPHGDYDNPLKECTLPGVCGDGFVAAGDQSLVAAGGWFSSNTPGADIKITLDGARVDFTQVDATKLENQHKFLGVIEPQGFTQFEGAFDDQKKILPTTSPFPWAVRHLRTAMGMASAMRLTTAR